MDPVQTATVEVNPRLESAGSTSAISADGYDAKIASLLDMDCLLPVNDLNL